MLFVCNVVQASDDSVSKQVWATWKAFRDTFPVERPMTVAVKGVLSSLERYQVMGFCEEWFTNTKKWPMNKRLSSQNSTNFATKTPSSMEGKDHFEAMA
jgi:hypothetical protein